MNRAGHVIVLNGSASAGKSSLAQAVHDRADTMWLILGQDVFAQSLIDRWVMIDADGSGGRSDGFTFVREPDGTMVVELGDVGRRLVRGYRCAVGAAARAGSDVIVDEAMFDPGGRAEWDEALAGLGVTWVRVDCSLEVAEERERSRPDRRLIRGLARGLYERVHADVDYDLTVDTTDGDLDRCAREIVDAVDRRRH